MIIDEQRMNSYLEVQLVGRDQQKIKAKTSTGQYIFVYPTKEQSNDPIFWQSMKDIIKNQLWLPITKQFHQLLNSDWLLDPTVAYN